MQLGNVSEGNFYFSDCMECMANSDNVVRAGLTPKFKDVDVLTGMLTFEAGKDWIMPSVELEIGKLLYKPPVDEFAVEVYDVKYIYAVSLNSVFIFLFVSLEIG